MRIPEVLVSNDPTASRHVMQYLIECAVMAYQSERRIALSEKTTCGSLHGLYTIGSPRALARAPRLRDSARIPICNDSPSRLRSGDNYRHVSVC